MNGLRHEISAASEIKKSQAQNSSHLVTLRIRTGRKV